jgi:hypothetical protein
MVTGVGIRARSCRRSRRIGELHDAIFVSLIMPILVVPDDTLWAVNYAADGARTRVPAKVDRCSFFVGRDYSAGDRMRSTKLTISHLELVTVTGLERLTKNILVQGNDWFPAPE